MSNIYLYNRQGFGLAEELGDFTVPYFFVWWSSVSSATSTGGHFGFICTVRLGIIPKMASSNAKGSISKILRKNRNVGFRQVNFNSTLQNTIPLDWQE